MYQKLNIPVLGLIENMSYFVCPSCGHVSDIFGRGGAEQAAVDARMVPYSSGRIPLYEPIQGRRRSWPPARPERTRVAGRARVVCRSRGARRAQFPIAAYQKPRDPLTPVT